MKISDKIKSLFKSSAKIKNTPRPYKNICGYCGWCEKEALDERKFCQRHEDLVKYGF